MDVIDEHKDSPSPPSVTESYVDEDDVYLPAPTVISCITVSVENTAALNATGDVPRFVHTDKKAFLVPASIICASGDADVSVALEYKECIAD